MDKSIITALIISLIIPLTSVAQNGEKAKSVEKIELEWLSWNEGYPKAQETGKILLIDLYTDWCGWCKKMDKDTYAKSEVINMIEEDFIPVKFNPEKTNITYDVDGTKVNGRQLMGMLVRNQRVGYQTTIFLFTEERKVYLEPGYKNKERFITTLNKYKKVKSEL